MVKVIRVLNRKGVLVFAAFLLFAVAGRFGLKSCSPDTSAVRKNGEQLAVATIEFWDEDGSEEDTIVVEPTSTDVPSTATPTVTFEPTNTPEPTVTTEPTVTPTLESTATVPKPTVVVQQSPTPEKKVQPHCVVNQAVPSGELMWVYTQGRMYPSKQYRFSGWEVLTGKSYWQRGKLFCQTNRMGGFGLVWWNCSDSSW